MNLNHVVDGALAVMLALAGVLLLVQPGQQSVMAVLVVVAAIAVRKLRQIESRKRALADRS